MTIQLLAGSLLIATGMSYGSYNQTHTVEAPPAKPVSAPAYSADPYIQKRNQQRMLHQQAVARQRADDAALLARHGRTRLAAHPATPGRLERPLRTTPH